MKIQHTQVIKPGEEPDDLPAAIEIDIAGVKVVVNRHTAVTTIDGAQHVTATAGDNNTLKVHACPDILKMIEDLEGVSSSLFGGIGDELFPGVRIASMSDLLARMPGQGGPFSSAFPRDPFQHGNHDRH